MLYMLDTNICSYIIKNKPLEVLKKFETLHIEDCCISSITLAELRFWVANNKRLHEMSGNSGEAKINEQIINQFVGHLVISDFDSHAASIYGEIRSYFKSKGIVIGNLDLLIGSHALSLGICLVTNNLKEFSFFPNLKLENWVLSQF